MGLPGSLIDTHFDMNSDAGGRDTDSHSKTLRRYHQLLWSKPLPSGKLFTLDAQLHHKSDLGEFWLSSDGIIHTYSRWTRPKRMVEVVAQVPPGEVAAFYELACTIGGYLPFPRTVRTGGVRHQSINQCRGTHSLIRDRFDLTLESIRRHYEGAESPLTSCPKWHADFFDLFGDFAGYVDFFLLNDLVSDRVQVQFMTAFMTSRATRCRTRMCSSTWST